MNRSLRITLNVGRFCLGVALVYWIIKHTDGWDRAKPVLSTVWLAAALIGLGFAGVGVEAMRLRSLLYSQGGTPDLGVVYRIIMIGTFFNVCIPGGTGGDLMKLYYLARANKGRGVEVAMVLLVDRVLALASMLTLICIFAVIDGESMREDAVVRWLVIAAGVFSAALYVGMAICLSPRVRGHRLFNWLLDRLPLSKFLHRAVDAVHAFRTHKGRLVFGVLISMVGHLALSLMFYFMGKIVLPEARGIEVCLLSFLGILANVLPVTPGGLGVGEAAFEALFSRFGFSGGPILLIVWRIASLPLVFLGGLYYMFGKRHRDAVLAREGLPIEGPDAPAALGKENA